MLATKNNVSVYFLETDLACNELINILVLTFLINNSLVHTTITPIRKLPLCVPIDDEPLFSFHFWAGIPICRQKKHVEH